MTVQRERILRLFVLVLTSYGLLYFSYKYYIPLQGGSDFTAGYYKMYLAPLDFSVTSPPLVFRQLSAIATHLVYLAGIYYPADIQFHDAAISQRIFFAALLTNYSFIVGAA